MHLCQRWNAQEKNAVHRYLRASVARDTYGLSRRGLPCSPSNSYEFRKSSARDLQLIVVSRLCNCSGRESQRSPLRLPSFCKTKALMNQPTRSADWRTFVGASSPGRAINLLNFYLHWFFLFQSFPNHIMRLIYIADFINNVKINYFHSCPEYFSHWRFSDE